MKKAVAALVMISIIAGCEKDFLVNQQTGAKKMVINSLFNDTGPLTVYITDSYLSAGSNNINSIADARIELYENNNLMEVMRYKASDSLNTFGAYISQLMPRKGNSYAIKVSEPVYGQASAIDTIPLPVPILSSKMLQYGDSATNSRDVIIDMNIADDGSTENYYRIDIWFSGLRWFLDTNGDTITQQNYDARGPQMLTAVLDTVRDNGNFLLFSDRNFNGQTKELKMKFDKVDPANFVKLDIFVELYTASKADYNYQKTLALYRNSSNSYSSEPVHVFSNIQNGYGIFAAEQFQLVQFNIK